MDPKFIIPTCVSMACLMLAWGVWLYEDHRVAYPDDSRLTCVGYAMFSLVVVSVCLAVVFTVSYAAEMLGVVSVGGP